MDRVSSERRSWIMAQVKGSDTRPEKIVRSLLHRMGYRFRLHRKDLPGNPDIVLPKFHTVIFVNGCFWHRHPGCKRASTPAVNVAYWQRKFERNVARDAQCKAALECLGWRVLVIWECELKDMATLCERISKFLGEVVDLHEICL
ncbi:very short patch repair endonuclease [Desulfovibrio sp. SGI.082]|uniref:very short patch repair endonuclease n=1 Tax=unclassified Desulfovibrio TaxID=2593640 RepID=UPI003CFE0C08